MAKKPADLSQFQVNIEKPLEDEVPASRQRARTRERRASPVPLITKGFRVKPDAARQFDMLKAEVSGNGKDKGPTLIAEALNLLFKKYGKSPVD
jgi:hypothetical protein